MPKSQRTRSKRAGNLRLSMALLAAIVLLRIVLPSLTTGDSGTATPAEIHRADPWDLVAESPGI